MKLDEMTLLIRVADTGSMTLAARQLHLTPAAVSAAVQRIENAIDVLLFERTTRSVKPTDEGVAVIDGCREVVDLWQRTLDDARGQRSELRGSVHLSAPADTTYQLLEPMVAELCVDHPKLRLVLHTGDAIRHLHRDVIDLAIRYGPLQDSTLSARKLADCPGILVAAPSYLAERGAPEGPEALADHRCLTLQLSGSPVLSWRLEKEGKIRRVPLDSPLCGDGYLSRRWALAGMGIALKNVFDVIDDLEAGRLVRVLPDYVRGDVAIHAVFPSGRFMPSRVRALADAVASRFATRQERCTAWLARTA